MRKSYVGALANKSRFASVLLLRYWSAFQCRTVHCACKSTSPLGRSKWYMPGYCMHAAVPLPALHWPYVALFEVSCHAGRGFLLRGMRPANSRSPPSKRYGPTHRLLLENTLSASERTISLLQVPYVSHTGIGQQRRLCQRS
jgi:hypothetical protein